MPIRLLFLNTRDRCGADVAVHLSLMAHLRPEEAEVFVFSNSEAADADDMRARFARMPHVRSFFVPLGKPAHVLESRNTLSRALAYLPSLASLLRIALFVRRMRIQVLHATDRPRDASYVSLLGRLTGAISVVHMHAPVGDLSPPTLWGLRNATAVFAVSEFVRSSLIGLGIEAARIHTLHNAVDADYFDPDRVRATPPSLRRRFGIPADAPLVGIAARLNPWKGQRELIGAAARLREAFPDLHVVILAGDNPEVPEARTDLHARAAKEGIADRVHFLPFQTDVRPFLAELDLFVHPSYGEPFGLAIVEAMAMRKPVIACASGGVPEIISHGNDGWLVEERSVEAVAEGIRHLLQDESLRRGMGTQARETVRNRFSPGRQSAAAAQRYARLVASS